MYKCSRTGSVVLIGKKRRKKDFIEHFCLRRVGTELHNPNYSKLYCSSVSACYSRIIFSALSLMLW